MVLEILSWSVGVDGISVAFSQAIKTINLIQSSFDPHETDPYFLALRYHIVLTRLEQWGTFCGVGSHSDYACSSPLSRKPKPVQDLIIRILKQIKSLEADADSIIKKHNIDVSPTKPAEDRPNTKALMKKIMDFRQRLTWVRRDRNELETILTQLDDLVTHLEAFVPECHLSSGTLTASILAKLSSKEQLEALAHSNDKIDRALASSAKAKAILDASPADQAGNASHITRRSLTLAKDSRRFGILQTEGNMPLSVWMEWNIIKAGRGSEQYVQRIKSLAYLLERVSRPEVCLPPCFGFYEDVGYERRYGKKCIGLVFGVPNQDPNRPEYDGNLQSHRPRTLASLIQDQKNTPIPLLGDRFQLALEIATTFNCFHAAGWLHKGLNPHSILFFHRVDGRGISVTKPFITGFQFSRPRDEESLSQGPLEDSTFDQYYHPDAHNGFTKPRDLYGLGVVLCEIGQWRLMADRVSERQKATLVNRSAWHDFIINKVLADIGWRMGKHYQSAVRALLFGDLPAQSGDEVFAQQYLEKVIYPLSKCVA